ncbi:hypothetical protein [Tissierella sp. Yu-01]|uniref:hypothetical protein n=1 Tax=Tissierella sp. Yu-01 TaxID=3035694 RepID=UPI00240D54C3|nr:hypothetical protein [Tissierella sp. Yu-01]WFA08749.1 hypothetical protein P3962_13630 [Tissierella sp. Yu-01]
MHEMKMTPNESLQLLELLTTKNLAYTKSVTMSKLVTCESLKTIMQEEIKLTEGHIKELRDIIEEKSEIY